MKAGIALNYSRDQCSRFLTELCEFVRFPSISAQPRHADDLKRCATWLANQLRQTGLDGVQTIPTPRHPLVYAEWRRAPRRPTVLIYGHYDVQPVDPLQEWRTPPFEPAIRNGNLYGRGASDDKGQLFCHIKALEAYLKTMRRLPVNVICLFEGEEEIGSPNLQSVLEHHRDKFAADTAVISDTRFLAPGRPALIYGLRGGLGLELEVSGPRQDIHSGSFGGAVHNPIQVLCALIARLHDTDRRIAIPGFYDRVRSLSKAERRAMSQHGPTDRQILQNAGVAHGWGERGYTAYERTTSRPALTINGISGGYQGAGGKGIIPARATAKISFRLVSDQDPQEIEQLVRQQIERITPPTVHSSVRTYLRTPPALLDPNHPSLRAAVAAYRSGFGVAPVFLRSGGSIPVVNMFQTVLGISTVLMGFALPDDGMHGPNEKFQLNQFYQGIATCIHFLAEIGKQEVRRSQRRAIYQSP